MTSLLTEAVQIELGGKRLHNALNVTGFRDVFFSRAYFIYLFWSRIECTLAGGDPWFCFIEMFNQQIN